METIEIKCTNKESYDTLLEECKAKGLNIVERGSLPSGDWYFKYLKTN